MSTMSKLDLLSTEVFGEFGFDKLTEFEKQVILTIFELDEVKDYTDLSIFE